MSKVYLPVTEKSNFHDGTRLLIIATALVIIACGIK